MPSVLFVHNGAPGRFQFLGSALRSRGWRCALINGSTGTDLPDVPTLRWSLSRGTTPGMFDLAVRAEADIMRGYAAAECAAGLKAQGFEPDIIIGHPGWGEMLFLAEVFPGAPQIQIGEFYYKGRGSDVNFDPEFPLGSLNDLARVHAKNAGLAMCYATASRIVASTPFQASLLPAPFRERTVVIHEGIDTRTTTPRTSSELVLADGVRIPRGAPLITFINRFLEPLRGFHTFMRALPAFQKAVPDARVLIVGSENPEGYGRPPPQGTTWKQILLSEVGAQIDASRVHFTGQLPYASLLEALSISTAHVYLTYPFVLSWSLLDAMACECLVVGSDTAPVRDVLRDGANGLLVDFFDHEGLAAKLADICRDPARYSGLRRAARQTVVRDFDRVSVCEPAWLSLIDAEMAARAG